MGQLTALDLTHARVGEVGALKGMAVGTGGAFVAVAVEAKVAADGRSW